jgi:hypothetical protein
VGWFLSVNWDLRFPEGRPILSGMNPPKKEAGNKAIPTNRSTAADAVERAGKIKQQKFDKTGATSRVKGHVAARGKRNQAKRDSR